VSLESLTAGKLESRKARKPGSQDLLTSKLPGFLAFRLSGFLAFWLSGFLAFGRKLYFRTYVEYS
jgi:hypothetical protein